MKVFPLFTGVLFLFSLLPALSVQAQIQLGVKAGTNANTFRVIENDFFFFDGATIAGPNLGLFGLIEGKDSPLGLRFELLYSMKGGQNRFLVNDVALTNTLRLHYVSLPVLFNIHRGNIYLEAGPELSYLLTAKAAIVQGPDLGEVTDEIDSRTDLSLALGMYYKHKKFQAGFRYLHGFSTIDKLEGVNFDGFRTADEVIKNKSVQFWIGYTLMKK